MSKETKQEEVQEVVLNTPVLDASANANVAPESFDWECVARASHTAHLDYGRGRCGALYQTIGRALSGNASNHLKRGRKTG